MTDETEVTDEGDELDKALAAIRQQKPPKKAADPDAALAALRASRPTLGKKKFVDAKPDDSPEPGYLERFATHVLNTAQGLPGMEAVEAAFASGPQSGFKGMPVTRTGAPVPQPTSYAESLDKLRDHTDQIGGGTKFAEKAMGSLLALPLVEGMTAAQAGAALGGADQALAADPIRSKGDVAARVGKTALGAGAGAVLGKTLDLAPTAVRGLAAKTPGANALDREAGMAATDARLYGQAGQEATQAGGTSPEIQTALADPVVKPFADKVRALDQFKTASDADVLTETYKQMGEYERRLGTTITNATDFLPTKAAMEQHIRLGKSRMLGAADPTMPSFRPAVKAHAQAEGEMDALETGVDAARRAMKNSATPPKKLDTKSPEAILQLLRSLPPEEQQAAEQGILGELGSSARVGLEPTANTLFGTTKGFGVGSYAADAARVAPLLRSTNTKTQQAIDALIKAGLLTTHAATAR